MIDIARLKLSNATAPGGTPLMRVATPVDSEGQAAVDLDRGDVEELRDVCEAWLRGEVLR